MHAMKKWKKEKKENAGEEASRRFYFASA